MFNLNEKYKNILRERILSRVKKEKRCWIWQGYKKKVGLPYGQIGIQINGKNTKIEVHRLGYFLFRGTFDSKKFVLHKCHNASCCNPAHLYLGDAKKNYQDMIEANRSNPVKGENHPSSKLTEREVVSIFYFFFCGWERKNIAKYFKVSINTIRSILCGFKWKHIQCLGKENGKAYRILSGELDRFCAREYSKYEVENDPV